MQSSVNKFIVFISCISFILCSCSNKTISFSSKQHSIVKDNVQTMLASIAKDVSDKGPIAWLDHFENSADFFMASNGELVFPNIDTAKTFINTVLVKNMIRIKLQWKDPHIDPLSSTLASVSAYYHEDATDSTGKNTPYDGYFTGIAVQTAQGWTLHNAHWSIATAKKDNGIGNPVVHFEIGCKDLAKTTAFYTTVFGWLPTGAELTSNINTNSSEGIQGHITALGHEPDHYVTVYIQVENIKDCLQKIDKAGGKKLVGPIKLPTGQSFAWFRDLDGNVVGLLSKPIK